MKLRIQVIFILIILFGFQGYGQEVSIIEEIKSLNTYGFGKPNPVPILSENPKIFPYFKFDKYEHTAKKKDWKVITLENDYIKVMVLPEIGGKVWGAIEKSTGEEFLYKNEVIKFRNIAMRGPWTSGGIEFNFGIIGHHPSTSTPVDYITRTNDDGSVSCIVGNTDLPSNTKWQVEIRLENDKAYFETNASWYNASPLTESYYNWMTAAAVATEDLEFFIPGNAYVEHDGDAQTWPLDEEGRNLAMYRNNNFGPSKSYHVVGEYNDFFGGYYHDSEFGFGQWAPYEEMPGQKLWLWALSRSGGIWEDLLTDTDGQYIEFQAGRLLDQYSGGSINPISQVGFDPYIMDRWGEIWFPYKKIGGMVDASLHGVLNVKHIDDEVYVGLNPLQKLDNDILIKINGKEVLKEKLNLNPMEIFSRTFPAKTTDDIQVSIKDTELSYSSASNEKSLKRPFHSDLNLEISESEALLNEGIEALEFRDYTLAHDKLSELVQLDPSHNAGLLKLAELEYRKTAYSNALKHANTVLEMDTYNSGANYISGISYRALNDTTNALESLGWAARDIKFRTVSYAQMGEIYLAAKNYGKAKIYAQKALDFNTYNLNARKILVAVARKQGSKESFQTELSALLKIDPLSHFAHAEKSFNESDNLDLNLQNEFPSETVLQLALQYYHLGLIKEAITVLQQDLNAVKNKLWLAYIIRNSDKSRSENLINEIVISSVNFVFPYRRETLPVLEWAVNQYNGWKLHYYLAQNYLAVGKLDDGKTLLKKMVDNPDSDVFYRFRASMLQDASFNERAKDYKKALVLNNNDWKVWEEIIQFYLKFEKYGEAYEFSKKASKKFPNNYNIDLAHAKSLLNTGRYEQVLKIFENIQILPYEHASESREIYERAHITIAKSLLVKKDYKKAIDVLEKSKLWPENIGVGKPYNPDERVQDFLLAIATQNIGEIEKNSSYLKNIVTYTENHIDANSFNHLYGLLALKKLGVSEKLMRNKSALKENTTDKNKKSQLALALFETDSEALTKLKSENVVPQDVWDVASWAISESR